MSATTVEAYGPEHPFHVGFYVSVGLPVGTTEEDAKVALGVVQERFPTARLMERRMNGWDVSSHSYDAEVAP